MDKIWYRNP